MGANLRLGAYSNKYGNLEGLEFLLSKFPAPTDSRKYCHSSSLAMLMDMGYWAVKH